MAANETEVKVQIYECNGVESKVPVPTLTVRNHWNRSEFVRLQVGDNVWTVLASDLERAIAAAKLAHRY